MKKGTRKAGCPRLQRCAKTAEVSYAASLCRAPSAAHWQPVSHIAWLLPHIHSCGSILHQCLTLLLPHLHSWGSRLQPKASALTTLPAALPALSPAPASRRPRDSSSRCQKAATSAMLILAPAALRAAALCPTQVCSCWLINVPSRRGHSPWSGSEASGVEG